MGNDVGLGPWGIFDTVDRCWIGDSEGPLIYSDLDDARMAATILNERMGYSMRFLPKTYPAAVAILKDTVTPPLSAEEAISRLEGKEVIHE